MSHMVYLHHCNSNGAKLLFENGDRYSIMEMMEHFIDRLHLAGTHRQSAHLIEINRFGNIDRLEDVLAHHRKALYGIISGNFRRDINQTRTNTIVNILTIIGLVIAFLQLVQ